jgi:hypothetical protein
MTDKELLVVGCQVVDYVSVLRIIQAKTAGLN